jgi:hypothetical protein
MEFSAVTKSTTNFAKLFTGPGIQRFRRTFEARGISGGKEEI